MRVCSFVDQYLQELDKLLSYENVIAAFSQSLLVDELLWSMTFPYLELLISLSSVRKEIGIAYVKHVRVFLVFEYAVFDFAGDPCPKVISHLYK